MKAREALEAIIEEAQELLGKANAGGTTELAFDLTVDVEELNQAHDMLDGLGTRIVGELEV